jgi:catechol 2,3-dioxygenase-like lactoylglutathione lyase family enzyme
MQRRKFIVSTFSTAVGLMLAAHEVNAALPQQVPGGGRKEPLIRSLRLNTNVPLPEMRKFYETTIGLPVLAHSQTVLTFGAGLSQISFLATPGASRPFYHFAFNIPENKIEAAFAWQRKRTPIIHPNADGPRDAVTHFAHWNAHSVFFLDPAGNLVEYIARHELPNAAPGGFSVKDILCVSEIGFILDDIGPTGNAIMQAFSLPEYRSASDGFWPIGDELGLLLMIRKGMVWSAHSGQVNKTDIFPTSVTIDAPNRKNAWRSSKQPYEILTG